MSSVSGRLLLIFPRRSGWLEGDIRRESHGWGNETDLGHSKFKAQTPPWRCSEDVEDARQKPQSSQGSHERYLHREKSSSVGLSEVGSEWGGGERTGRFLGARGPDGGGVSRDVGGGRGGQSGEKRIWQARLNLLSTTSLFDLTSHFHCFLPQNPVRDCSEFHWAPVSGTAS